MLFVQMVTVIFLFQTTHKKEARVKYSCLSRHVRPSHCPFVWNKQCRSPRYSIYSKTLYYQTMDEEHCVIAIQTSEVAKFNMTADKRRYNVFSICSAAPAERAKTLAPPALPVALEGLRRCGNDGAKIQLFFDIKQKKIFPRSQHSKKVTKVTTYFSKSHGEMLRVMEGFFRGMLRKILKMKKDFASSKSFRIFAKDL